MDVVVYKPSGETVAVTSAYKLDLSFGSSGNNFEFTVDMEEDIQLDVNWMIAIEGTEYGGIVDGRTVEVSGSQTFVTWSGRTWHGVLNSHIVAPDAGKDYYSVSGDANQCLRDVISHMGLGQFFSVKGASAGVSISYKFARPAERGYDGIMNMLRNHGLRLMCKRYQDRTELWAEHTTDRGQVADSDVADFTAENTWRPPNHLYCAGTGELKDRNVLHLYADAKGNVSKTQTLFGLDEVAEIYDYSNADAAKLLEDGTKKLKDMQSFGKVDVKVTSGDEMYIGDTVIAHDRKYGQTVQDVIVKKVLKIDSGIAEISYECGENASSSGGISHATAEWSGGGATYSAGDGITIVDHTISASVTPSTISSISSRVSNVETKCTSLTSDVQSVKQTVQNAAVVVDSGTTTIGDVSWHWMKYSDGNAVLAGLAHAGGLAITGASANGVYYSRSYQYRFPFTFANYHVSVITDFSNSPGIYGTWLPTWSTSSATVAVWSNSPKSAIDGYIHIQVHGRWK